jgi:hypothetical protein
MRKLHLMPPLKRTPGRSMPPVLLTVIVLAIFAAVACPHTGPGEFPGVIGDSLEYTYGAESLLQGHYLVSWDGGPPRPPLYPPGFSLLLVPAVALGGFSAAPWTPFITGLLAGTFAAVIGAKLAGRLVAPFAAACVQFSFITLVLAEMVMSDLPAGLFVVMQVPALMIATPWALALAGFLGGALAWIRPAMVLLVLAGLCAITAHQNWRGRVLWYLLGALIPIVGLGWWQLATFGSPLVTSYQAARANPAGSSDMTAFFSLRYVLGEPYHQDGPLFGGSAAQWGLPNGLTYPLQLLGLDGYVTLPGLGLIGVFTAIKSCRGAGHRGTFARFVLATAVITLCIYVPYYWQSARYLIAPGLLLSIAGAVGVSDVVQTVPNLLRSRAPRFRPRRTVARAPALPIG